VLPAVAFRLPAVVLYLFSITKMSLEHSLSHETRLSAKNNFIYR